MRALLLIALLAAGTTVSAQIYRWVDEKGRVNYSNWTPEAGVEAKVIDLDAKAGPPSPESWECYTVRCQGERLEQRLARRDELEARLAAGLEFRRYISIQRGMHEGELVSIAGSPDLLFWDARSLKTYTYLPTVGDPFTTTITLIRGRISDIDRVRKF
jgi:hypothetical protein